MKAQLTTALLFLLPAVSLAQVPVDDNGNVIGNYESQSDVMPIGDDGIPRLSHSDLQELVGPIALYPDDLLAIVLPASAYPLQIVEAARFLEALETDPTLNPDPDWDDSIVALINYPEVVELLNEDLDWTWRLGEAVVAQQADVVSAVESFRDRAYAAGNLKSDSYQTVSNDEGVINISPAAEDVIYVPYYEPARVVHYQPRPVYYYYPQPYPVYYYPYASNHYFDRGYFWGVTTAFSIGWMSDSLHVYHHSYRGHPYYGRTYWNDGWYRNPSINVYNTTYISNTNVTVNRHSTGDQWRARDDRREYVRREGYSRAENRSPHRSVSKDREYEPITFRERDSRTVNRADQRQRSTNKTRDTQTQEPVVRSRDSRQGTATRTRDTRRQEPVVRTRDASRESAADRSQRSSAYRPEPSRQTRENATTRAQRSSVDRTAPSRQTREQAPTRSTERSPAPRERRQSEARTRQQSPPQRAPRSQETKSSGSNSDKPKRRSSERRSQSEDRQH